MSTWKIARKITVNNQFTIDVPESHILALLDAAGTGIAYWAGSAVVDTGERTYTVRVDDEQPSLDRDHPRERVLDFDWIAKMLVRLSLGDTVIGHEALSAGYARQWLGALMKGDLDADSFFDADIADTVVQLCFFRGELVFG